MKKVYEAPGLEDLGSLEEHTQALGLSLFGLDDTGSGSGGGSGGGGTFSH